MNGHTFKMLYRARAKANRSDPSIQGNRGLSEVNGTEEEEDATNSENVEQQQQSMSFVVRRTSNVVQEKSNISNDHCTPTNLQKRGNHSPVDQCDMDVSSTPKFVEYWVPVRLSSVQMEIYCGSLLSNSKVLCSSVKLHNKTETLQNMLISTRKCCDHPKLVDSSLHEPEKYNEIKLSSKLLLLSKILQEISKRGLRVVVLYQTLGDPGPIHTGHILDDIIHDKFGQDSFVHIGEGLSKPKLQVMCDTYNDKGRRKFIFLTTTRACAPSIHLQSVDVVIFFNSDWNPANDLRALQKIKLDSQLEHVKVFRLYSAFTVEEKLIMHAKQSTAPADCNMRYIKQSICHELLNWGAYYLFGKLDELHGSSTTDDAHSFVEDVLLELSNLLPNNEEEIRARSTSSFIVEVEQIGGLYPRNVCLLGEKEYPLMKKYSKLEEMILKEPPHIFWTNILQGRKTNWSNISSQSSLRTRNGVQRSNDTNFEASVQARASKKCKTQARKNQLQSPDKESLLPAGEAAAPTTRQEPSLQGNSSPTQPSSQDKQDLESQENVSPSQSQELQQLERELEKLEKQKTESLKQHQDKKLQVKMALEKEIEEISKKYEAELQNADIGFAEERQVLDTKCNKLFIKRLVIEAKMRRTQNFQ